MPTYTGSPANFLQQISGRFHTLALLHKHLVGSGSNALVNIRYPSRRTTHCHASIVVYVGERRVGGVQLTDPQDESWCSGRRSGELRIVWANKLHVLGSSFA